MGRRRAIERLAMVAGAAAFGCGSDDDSPDPAEDRSVSSLDGPPPASGAAGAAPSGAVTSVNEGSPEVAALDAPASWDEVPTCTASADGAGPGPFFIHDGERDDDVELFRQDIRGRYDAAAEPGTELWLHVRVLDGSSSDCGGAPVPDVDVYIWHTDAQGYYSGFGEPGAQNPDEPYAGVPNQNDLDNTDRFCRGAQVTDENGVVSFRSIFPGWYNGRDIHVHFLALRRGSEARGRETYSGGDHLFTTQFYFDPALTDRVHKASEPYLRRTSLPAYEGSIQADEPGNSGLRAQAEFDGTRVVAQIQIVLPGI
jgi:protocatechuate 3,4-dioxygenase beta subunit